MQRRTWDALPPPVSADARGVSAWRRASALRPVAGGSRWRCWGVVLLAVVTGVLLAVRWWHPAGAIAPRWSPHELLHSRRWSPPLVTRDAWRDYAEHVCDTVACAVQRNPDAVRPGDVVWVGIDVALQYLQAVAPAVGAPHVVVSHDGDVPFTAAHAAALDARPGIVAWFAQNIDAGVVHPRLLSVPIGVENRRYDIGRYPALYTSLPRFANLQRWVQRGATLLRCMVGAAAAARERDHAVASAGSAAAPAPTQQGCLAAGRAKLVYAAFSTATNPTVRVAAARAVAGMPWVTNRVAGFTSDAAAEAADSDDAVLADLAAAAQLVGGGCTAQVDAVVAAAGAWGGKAAPASRASAVPLAPQQPGAIPSWAWDTARGMNPALAATLRANFADIAAHPFVLSPPGNGHQAHRTWEALYAGSVPITLRYGNAMDAVLEGLPAMQVREFSAATLSRPALFAALARAACVWQRTAAAAAVDQAAAAGVVSDHGTFEPPQGYANDRVATHAAPAASLEDASAGSAGVWHLERAYAGWWLAAVDRQRWRTAP